MDLKNRIARCFVVFFLVLACSFYIVAYVKENWNFNAISTSCTVIDHWIMKDKFYDQFYNSLIQNPPYKYVRIGILVKYSVNNKNFYAIVEKVIEEESNTNINQYMVNKSIIGYYQKDDPSNFKQSLNYIDIYKIVAYGFFALGYFDQPVVMLTRMLF